MKKLVHGSLLTVCLVSGIAMADHAPVYGVGAIGVSSQKLNAENMGVDTVQSDAKNASVTLGFKACPHAAVELGYTKFKDKLWTWYEMPMDFKSEAVTLTGLVGREVIPGVSVFGRLGAAMHRVRVVDWHGTYVRPVAGVGVDVEVADDVAVRVSYDDYFDAGHLGKHQDNWSIGLKVGF